MNIPLANGRAGSRISAATFFAILVISSSAAQSRPATTQATTQPVDATQPLRVTADTLNVRSRADANSQIVTQIRANAIVEAVGQEGGWYRIVPPAGAFSFVAAQYIDMQGEDVGVVSTDSGTLRVRVGSTLRTIDPMQAEVQTRLERGTRVKVLGQQGEWLKIEPPAGIYLYISDRYAVPVSPDVAAAFRAARAEGRATTQPIVATTQSVPDEPEDTWARKLARIETDIAAESRRSVLTQNWQALIERLEPIAAQRMEPLPARLATGWIAQLEARQADQEAARVLARVKRETDLAQTQHERELERIRELRRRTTLNPDGHVARGEFQLSFAPGERDDKRWYKLVDPISLVTVAYLEIAPSAQSDLRPLLGGYVGVDGEKRFDTQLGADVIRVTRIATLQPPASQPARPQP